ncbi:MAG: 23S rRNA (uracil(1939)-C(5))-methyltransferase RlmD [Turicibacter sp.]|nr:23S rRNA (uracil(1939)-C(5))-methyltransferase RlmD [Turicibacter sp.]
MDEISTKPLSCPAFDTCGGCSLLNLPYTEQLTHKRNNVIKTLESTDFAGLDATLIIPSPNITAYRNKMEFSFGDSADSHLELGIRNRRRFYEVTTPTDCLLITDGFKRAVMATLEYFRQTDEKFYHRRKHTGSLRYLVVRRGEFTGEMLVNLVTTSALDNELLTGWTALLLEKTPEIIGILHTTSDSKSDAVVPENTTILHGRDFFYEKLNGLTFGISPFAFCQTNSAASELLYQATADFVEKNSKNNDIIFDLYCGTGTIAQILSKKISTPARIIGVELVQEAIDSAVKNAELNGITNCEFIAGDVLKIVDTLKFSPDTIVLDPPRPGLSPKAIAKILNFNAAKIIYISCKLKSLARDLPYFQQAGYTITDMQIHDLFPHTEHIETLCVLEKS